MWLQHRVCGGGSEDSGKDGTGECRVPILVAFVMLRSLESMWLSYRERESKDRIKGMCADGGWGI